MTTKTLISPMLSVRRGSEAIEFYQTALGAELLFRIDDDAGDVVAQLAVDGADFWIHDESPEYANFSPESLNGSTTRMVLVVSDPDAAFERMIKAGSRVVSVVQEQHGWYIGRVCDPYGHHWEIGKKL